MTLNNESISVVDKMNSTFSNELLNLKESAKKQFDDFPTKKHESWKYLNLDETLNLDLNITPSKAYSLLDQAYSVQLFQNKVLIADNSFESGLLIQSFSDYSANSDQSLLASMTSGFNQTPFSYLNTVNFEEGVIISAAQSSVIQKPVLIDLQLLASEDKAKGSHHRVLVHVAKKAKLTVYLRHVSYLETPELINNYFDFTVEDEAELELVCLQEGDQPYLFNTFQFQLNEQSQLNFVHFLRDGLTTRHDINLNFHKENANAKLSGIALLAGESKFYNHLAVNHKVGNCECEQTFKTILTNKALSEFSGVVSVDKYAHGTNSSQSNPNLLLSDSARALSRPQLKIDADDVECAHGSTIGQLNDNEVYYLQSRGLTLNAARALLTFGFAEDIVQRVKETSIALTLEKILRESLNGYVTNN